MTKQSKNGNSGKKRPPKARPIFRAFLFGRDEVGTGMKQSRLPSDVEVQTQFFLRGGRLTARQLAEAIHGLPDMALMKLRQLEASQVACTDAIPTLESVWFLTAERRQAPVTVNPTSVRRV